MSKRSKRILDLLNANEEDAIHHLNEATTDHENYPTCTEPDRASSPAEYDEERTLCIQNLMGDVFSDKLISERRIYDEAVVSTIEETQAMSNDISTSIQSLVPVHEDSCRNEYCSICVETCAIRPNEIYENLPTPSTISVTSTNVTPTTQKGSRKKTYKTDVGMKRLLHKERWIEYKYDFDDVPMTLVVLRFTKRNTQRHNEFKITQAYDGSVLIPHGKYKDLNDMCRSGVIPEKYKSFYRDLPHVSNNAA
ncbi:unnamed protein product [Arctia plantaginis]|uniref:Uncharacterized protein n=1 Tax=Arctia plantaginis TaxID=874455 RepID=A0A8S1A4C9_ARCPL|nr:unnamed protein product [Arctia plantaginis]